jgi:hypothetical protein
LIRFLSDSRALCLGAFCFVFRWSSNTRIWSNYSFTGIPTNTAHPLYVRCR